MVNRFGFLHIINSSLWITVLVVRVGCIIEARASQVDVDLNAKVTSTASVQASVLLESPLKRKSTFRRYFTNRSIYSQQPSKTTTTMTTMQEDDDSCSGKADGYYSNFGSACTSYYFCAAGYQITYVCPLGRKFNGKKCDDDYVCPTAGHLNLCQGLPNGYYPNPHNSEKYFYCYQRAKVIELSCDKGKVFTGDKCIVAAALQDNTAYRKSLNENSCSGKSNGFYPDLQNNCSKYYYCIEGVKTDLECQNGLVFNGDTNICVHSSLYLCPIDELISTIGRSPEKINSYKNNRKDKSGNQTEHSLIANLVRNIEEESTTTNYG